MWIRFIRLACAGKRTRGQIAHGPDLLPASGMGALHPPRPFDAAMDGRHAGGVRLPLPAAQHRQRPRLGDPQPPRLHRGVGRDHGGGRGDRHAGPRRWAQHAHGAVPVRPRGPDLPRRGPVPHPARLEPVDRRLAQPLQGRPVAPDRGGGDRLVALHLHHELALHPAARAGALRGHGAVRLHLPAGAGGGRRLRAPLRPPQRRS